MMDLWLVILSVVAGALGIYYFLFRRNEFQEAGVPCSPSFTPLGNMLPILLRQISMAELVQNVYNVDSKARYVGMYDFATPVVIIRDPELIKSLTVKNFEDFPDHRTFNEEIGEPLFSNNLFSLRGQKWKEMRSLLSPAFTSSKMRTMFTLMSDCAAEFAEYWAKAPAESMDTVNMKDAFTRYTNDVIATCAFGVKVDSMTHRDNEFYVLGKDVTTFDTTRSLKFFFVRCFPTLFKMLGMKLFGDKAAKFFMNVVETTIRTRDEQGITRPDMIQLMMETRGKRADKDLTIEEMTSQAFIFFFGGFDSTSTLMCFLAHELAVNPEIQAKVQHEISQVLEQSKGELTYDSLSKMKYLDAVIDETLRLYPVAVALDRRCVKDFQLPPALPGAKPYTIKEDSYIWIPVYGIQRDEQYYEEPEKFNPDRFLDENKNERNLAAYLPFGMGPRMCIGNRFALMETKVLFFHLLSRFDLKPCEKTQIPIKLSKSAITMSPERGFWLKIQPRSLSKNDTVANGKAHSS